MCFNNNDLGRRFGASKVHLSRLPVAWAAGLSKAVVLLLLLIYCLTCFLLVVGVLCLSLLCYALCPLKFGNHLEEEEKAGCVAIIVFQMYCYYKYSVVLPHCAKGWSALYECSISWSYSLTFCGVSNVFRDAS